jgi:shikimate dehydrogenase
MPILNKDMQVCISLSARPSNIGTRFHNFLYDELGLNFLYKGFSTTDLPGAVAGIKALGFRGCSVSMPFKEEIIPFIDNMQPSALAIESVNTVVNDGGVLTAYNTDFEAVASLLRDRDIDSTLRVLVRGSGGMAKAVVAAFARLVLPMPPSWRATFLLGRLWRRSTASHSWPMTNSPKLPKLPLLTSS